NGMQNFFQAQGPQALWAPGGVFNINLYVQQVRRWKTPSAARDAVLEAIATGVIRYGFLFDEPYHQTRYGPGGIPLAHVRTAAAVYREVFEDLPLTMRAEPTFYDNQPIPGLSDYWYTVKVNRGPIAVKVAQYTALAANNGCGLGCSINCRDFNNTGGGVDAANDPGGWITPAQFALYGGQLAAFSSLKFFHGWWMLDPQWYQVAGMAAAVLGVRTKWIATHP
ncbi:MAG TPA: hypothetical protein VEB59_11275, partial [Gemmatimonadales bacterium]|nr:hypothetical protein [Gemmatimonadales bacterium]